MTVGSYHTGEMPCPAPECEGWIVVEVVRDDPWAGASSVRVVDQDGCTCDPEDLEENYRLGRKLDDYQEPEYEHRYDDFDPADVGPERDLPF